MFFPELLFPIFAATLYSFSVLFAKASTANAKFSPTSILVLNNLFMWLAFLPLLFMHRAEIDFSFIWQPLLIGVFFAMGNFATFLCAHKGEVSLMTPIMGVKILFVLLFSAVIAKIALSNSIIISGAICCAAVFIMGYTRARASIYKQLWTYLLALWACVCYAMCDVLFQKYSPNFSGLTILSISNFVLLISCIPYLKKTFSDFSTANRSDLSLGILSAFLMTCESSLMVAAIVGNVGAALCNILFNTRGIISVVLMFAVGLFYPNLRELSKGSAFRRVVGSLMILFAIYVALK